MAKKCFVITPIGNEGSEARERSNQVLKHLISPVAEGLGYKVGRSDKQRGPEILPEIVLSILKADLVVIDLSDLNPNVFYEMGLAHANGRPYVHIMQEGTKIPFDTHGIRTISYEVSGSKALDSFERAKQTLKEQIEYLEKNPNEVKSPLQSAVSIPNYENLETRLEKQLNEVTSSLEEYRRVTQKALQRPVLHERLMKDMANDESSLPRLIAILSTAYIDVAPWLHHLGLDAYRQAIASDRDEPLPIVAKFANELDEFNDLPTVSDYRSSDKESAGNLKLIDDLIEKVRTMSGGIAH